MARKRVKLSIWALSDYLSKRGKGIIDCRNTKITIDNNEVIPGVMCKLDTRLTDEEKAWILGNWKNTSLFVSQCQYAPEIKNSAVFIGNKCFNNTRG